MRVETWRERDWAEAVDRRTAGVSLQQSSAYGAAAARLGAQVRRWAVFDGDKPVAALQTLTRCRLTVLNGGPVWLAPTLCDETRRQVLRQVARQVFPLVATPSETVAGRGLIRVAAARTEAVLPLEPGVGALRAGLSGKWRNRLVRAERRGERVAALVPGARDLDWLLRAEAEQRAERGYRALPPGFVLAWIDAAPRDALLLHAGREAAMLFLLHGDGATYHIGWTSQEGRSRSLHTLILWTAIVALRERGVRRLNLGRIDPETAPGLARFKLGSGARTETMGPTVLVLPQL